MGHLKHWGGMFIAFAIFLFIVNSVPTLKVLTKNA
jgi:hypothetical protein